METKENKQLKENELKDVSGGIIFLTHDQEEMLCEGLNGLAVKDAGLKSNGIEPMEILKELGG